MDEIESISLNHAVLKPFLDVCCVSNLTTLHGALW